MKLGPMLGAAAAAIGLAAPAVGRAVPLDVRLGGWETTVTTTFAGSPRTLKSKTCVTKEDLDSEQAFQKDEDCTYTIKTRSASRWAGTAVCKRESETWQGEFDIQAKGRESIAMTMNSKISSKGGAKGLTEVHMELTGRWASPSCKGYED